MTIILGLPLIFTLLLAIFNPLWFRDDFLRWNERFAGKIANFRDRLPFVKYLDDKAHLFDTLRDSK
jgi:hypothetical protein